MMDKSIYASSRPRNLSELLSRLATQHKQMPAPFVRLADLLFSDPWAMAFDSAATLGRKSMTSQSTVVRFVQTMGYTGILHFRADYRRILLESNQAAKDVQSHRLINEA
ncbi:MULTISPECIES: hypothetical protein [unclassified Shinella]|uniref:hypothetical protein n=1 Tax=unclassified Shinella TaxID=2643062 RepID=UPI00225D5DAD|nr:hypothetical protein [Shinella sp. YE25]MDC7260139.1 hypothetical protein [Shinella sp. YE25]CAI0341116.1 hypothetical protein SHINE37_60084 [Rhizobiaceae bacterium]CAK7262153.1 protein of unknown function [Shinella sp. WSC3-e]